ncbi:MAG TPA: D-lyxose/D-mannose family sugar isomerase [Candidatus Limiplasma sp.]|nr:D-lyxose/D-mannose family sugar isomerase [Candidatus Limiplasma sp.]
MDSRAYAKARALQMLQSAGIALTKAEEDRLEIADFGLNDLPVTGLELITYVNTDHCCAKELVLLPGQTCPEHRHPPGFGGPGKEETFRCRSGEVYLYVEGESTPQKLAKVPPADSAYYTVHHEIVLRPGQQYTLAPNILHWFQAGPQGAIISEFSTASHDDTDVFTHPGITR